MREHSVSPEALSERAKHASLAAGETIGGASARGKNSTGSAFLYGSPGTSDLITLCKNAFLNCLLLLLPCTLLFDALADLEHVLVGGGYDFGTLAKIIADFFGSSTDILFVL